MSIRTPIAERLTRQLDQFFLPVLPNKRQIVRERIAIPQIALLQQQLQAVGALGTRAPAKRPLLRAIENHVRGSFDYVALFFSPQIARNFMMITMTRDFMALSGNRRQSFGITFGDAAAGKKSCSDFLTGKNPQNPPDPRVGTVFALGVFLVIDTAVLVRLHIFSALKVEAQKNRDARIARPLHFAIRV